MNTWQGRTGTGRSRTKDWRKEKERRSRGFDMGSEIEEDCVEVSE